MMTKLDTMTHAERAAFAIDLYRKDGSSAARIGWRLFLESVMKGGR